MRSIARAIVTAITCASLAGCGSGIELGTVTGKVTLNGEPVEGASVEFQPVESGSPSYGTTDAWGEYRLMYTADKAGAIPGEHIVRIHAAGTPDPNADEQDAEGEQIGEEQVTVEPGRNSFNFEL
jgi:hypothetical protein